MRRGEAWKSLREHGRWMRLSERAVFYALLERSDNNDCSIPPKMTPSLVQLAEACCCSKSTATLAVDHLAWHGWLIRKRSKGGRSHKSTYQLDEGFPCPPDCEKRLPASPSGGRRSPAPPKRSDSRTVYEEKRSDSRTQKRSDWHPQTRSSDRVSDEGIGEGGDREGSALTERRVCDVSAPQRAIDVTHSSRLCAVCQLVMDPVLPAAGFTTHPCCDPHETSPLWPVTEISQ